MTVPRVSIGLPVYNGEKFIGQTIESILGQTFVDFELVIANNASSDGTADICQKWAASDDRVRYVAHPSNLGAARNFNSLIPLARGEIFKWAAADDLLEPTFIERCVQVLQSDPEAVLCYAQTRIIDEHGKAITDYHDGFQLEDTQPEIRFRKFFSAPGLCNPVFGLIRTETLRRTAGIGGYASADRVLLGELALHGKFREVPERLFLRRIHPEQSTIANPTEVHFGIWFNPDLRGKFTFPRWRRFIEYIRAVGRAPLRPLERLRCYLVLLQFSAVPDRWAGLLGDVINVMPGNRQNARTIRDGK